MMRRLFFDYRVVVQTAIAVAVLVAVRAVLRELGVEGLAVSTGC